MERLFNSPLEEGYVSIDGLNYNVTVDVIFAPSTVGFQWCVEKIIISRISYLHSTPCIWLKKYRVNFTSLLLATFRPVFCDWLEMVVRHFSEYRSNNVCMIKTAVVDLVSVPKCGKQTVKCTFRIMPQTLPQLVITTLDIRVTMWSFKPELSYEVLCQNKLLLNSSCTVTKCVCFVPLVSGFWGTQRLFSVKYLFGEANIALNVLLLEDG